MPSRPGSKRGRRASCAGKLRLGHRKQTHDQIDILLQVFGSAFRSGSFARVKMMQAADFWSLDHLSERRRLDWSADRRIFFERQMCAALFVVFEIVFQDPAQPGLMEDDDVVQAFSPN